MASSKQNGRNGAKGALNGGVVGTFAPGSRADQAVQEALRDVRILHKKMGVPLVGWRDGKLVEIPPEMIRVDEVRPRRRKAVKAR